MTKRSMRNLPGVILMTTALAWNLPVLAQSGTVGGTQTPPAANSRAGSNQTPNQAPAMGTGAGINGTSNGMSGAGGNSATGAGNGLNSNGLPQGFSPAMPASSPKTMSSPELKAPAGEKPVQKQQR